MAVKKAASRKRTTTKRSKTTRSTTKRAAKSRSPAKSARADHAPAIKRPAVAEPVAAQAIEAEHAGTNLAYDERPSRFTGDYYLHATGPQPAEGLVRRPGKWLIFVSRSRIDALWEDVQRAVRAGRLGHAAKVSTALPNPLSPDPKKHVICVYTADEDDPADIRRVRDTLRGLGITWKIPYKSDAATRAGQYEVTTGGPAAKYYE
ncbi:MAG: putative phosphothreonine lyase domain-containing protein [Gemmatimonadaceae bacterium]